MPHPRRERYSPKDLLPAVQGDRHLETVLGILAQHRVVLGIRANGTLRARKLGDRTLHPDLAQLVARHAAALLTVVKAQQQKRGS